MKPFTVVLSVLTLLGLSLYVWSRQINPAQRASQIDSKRRQRISDAIKFNQPISIATIDEEAISEAKHDLRGVDSRRISAVDAFDWAKLYSVARDFKTERDLILRYLRTKPADDFQARLTYMRACRDLEDGVALAQMLRAMRPSTDAERWTVASSLGRDYSRTLRESIGIEATVSLFDLYEKSLPKAPYADEATRHSCEGARASLSRARAGFLVDQGRYREGIAELDRELAGLANDIFGRADLESDRRRYAMAGQSLPSFTPIRATGPFVSLEKLKGKVVILDFTAHWCLYCLQSLPSMNKLYADLHSQGLEILSITQFYGHFKERKFEKKDMSANEEFELMSGLMKEHGVLWPTLFVDPSVFKALNVQGLPQVFLIDRKGQVVNSELGFTPQQFARFRPQVEALLRRSD